MVLNLEPTVADMEVLVAAEAAGAATPAELARLEANRDAWAATLRRLIAETDKALRGARRLSGPERDQVLDDLTDERDRLGDAFYRVTGEDFVDLDDDGDGEPERPARGGGAQAPRGAASARPAPQASVDTGGATTVEVIPTGPPSLQASWAAGRVVVWGGGPGQLPVGLDDLKHLLDDAGATTIDWEAHGGVPMPGGARAEALAVPASRALGWLVAVGAGQAGHDAGPSVRWLGEIATWATELVAQGRMVPRLRRSRAKDTGPTSSFAIRWVPALIDPVRFSRLAARMPGAVRACSSSEPAEGMARAVLAGMVDSICREGAARLVLPAAPPAAHNQTELSEAVLSSLNGAPFEATGGIAEDLAGRIDRWTRPVTADGGIGLIVRLAAPDRDGAWLLSVHATGVEEHAVPVEVAMVTAPRNKRWLVEAHLARLERLCPLLGRPGGQRRGEVILSTYEAWSLMTDTGPVLAAAGFDVQVPPLSRRRPAPTLRLIADAIGRESVVGAQQLCDVRWSVMFDDVELDAAAIAALAAEARPLVRSRGRWVELDRADLAEAAAALAERASSNQLTSGAVLRQALGLEGESLAGRIEVDGSSWAADLLKATTDTPEPRKEPRGFVGKLRDYQKQALGWLGFLDAAGLGGCLALDMGLGKTPIMLAQLLSSVGNGPALVITPPAVLGNWYAEAARFTPKLKVVIHHGPGRAAGADELAKFAGKYDVILTTYGTALRDIDALEKIEWARVVIDEAQTIKNPASDAAQALRRLSARSRIALTGTPIENGLGDLWSILDFTNPGLVGSRASFVGQLSRNGNGGNGNGSVAHDAASAGEKVLRALNGLLVFRRTKSEPVIAAELPDRIDQLDHCSLTQEQIGLYQAVLDRLLADGIEQETNARKGQILAAITALKQICDHPDAFLGADGGTQPLEGRSGKLNRLEEIIEAVFAAGERILIFTHCATWGNKLAHYLTERTGIPISCYHGGLGTGARDRMVREFQEGTGPGALVLSLKAGDTGPTMTAANHVVLYDRWWNPATEDQARDRAWRIGQNRKVVCHRLVCPGTVDERVEEVVAGKRRIADLVLPKNSSLSDLAPDQLRAALGLRADTLIEDLPEDHTAPDTEQSEEDAA